MTDSEQRTVFGQIVNLISECQETDAKTITPLNVRDWIPCTKMERRKVSNVSKERIFLE